MKQRKLTVRMEMFAKAIALDNAITARDAWRSAYGTKASDAVADSAASRLLRNVKIQARVKQLRDERLRASVLTVDYLTNELLAIAHEARRAEQYAAASGALATAAKLNGLMVDKIEDVTKRRPALVPTEKTVITESDWLAMVGKATGSHAGNGKAN